MTTTTTTAAAETTAAPEPSTTEPEPDTSAATDSLSPHPSSPDTTAAGAPEVNPSLHLTPDESDVATDYLRDRDRLKSCSFDPGSCPFGQFATPDSPFDQQIRTTVTTALVNGLRAKAGSGGLQIRVDAVQVVGDTAFVDSCVYDTIILFDQADPTDPNDDIVFNDNKVSSRARWQLRKSPAGWLIYSSTSIDRRDGSDLCGF